MSYDESDEKLTYKVLLTQDPMFQSRVNRMYGGDSFDALQLISAVPMPDSLVICNGCNENLYPGECCGIYINDHLYDVYCDSCRQKYFEQAILE